MLPPIPQMLALASALCSAVSTMLIQRGVWHSNFYAGFWINIVVGMIGLWPVALLVVPADDYQMSMAHPLSHEGLRYGGRTYCDCGGLLGV
jgi:hypothetical protein